MHFLLCDTLWEVFFRITDLIIFLYLSLSFTHAHTHTHAPSHPHTQPPTHTLTPSHTIPHTLTPSHETPDTHTHTQSPTPSHRHTLTQPENILLCKKNHLDIKIADFGLAVQLQKGQEVRTLVGTAEYVGECGSLLPCGSLCMNAMDGCAILRVLIVFGRVRIPHKDSRCLGKRSCFPP